MGNAVSNWQSQFSKGFDSSGNDGFLMGFLVLLVLAAVCGLIFFWYRKTASKRPEKTKDPDSPRQAEPSAPASRRFDPLQQKIIYDLIDEFRKQEPSAKAVPSTVLEKYSDFFLQNFRRLKVSGRDARDFVKLNFPIRNGYNVEMDFHAGGSLYLIKSKVIETDARNLTVAFTGPIPAFIRKGTPLFVNYSIGKHFLRGASWVSELQPKKGIVLATPTHVNLTNERRYARVTLKTFAASLKDSQTGNRTLVKILDLSYEGVRVQVEDPLEKRHTYQLTFEAETNLKRLIFGPVECVLSKVFTTGSGAYECGLVFLYLDSAILAKLQVLMKHTAVEFPEDKVV